MADPEELRFLEELGPLEAQNPGAPPAQNDPGAQAAAEQAAAEFARLQAANAANLAAAQKAEADRAETLQYEAEHNAAMQQDQQAGEEYNQADARKKRDDRNAQILGDVRHALAPPNDDPMVPTPEQQQRFDALTAQARAAFEESANDPFEPYDAVKAFGNNKNASEQDKEAWKAWDALLRSLRLKDWTNFANRIHFHEDLMYGPSQDAEQFRLWSDGFARDPSGQIQWDYWMSDTTPENNPRSGGRIHQARPAAELLEKKEEYKSKLRFRPTRKPRNKEELSAMRRMAVRAQLDEDGNPKLDKNDNNVQGGAFKYMRDALTGAIEEDGEGFAKMEQIPELLQQHQQYIRDKKGRIKRDENMQPLLKVRERNVNHSVFRLRLQIISIRLNAHHWEWHYSRHLRNEEMYDTPSMTPYLHNKEFLPHLGKEGKRAHASDAAVPLLTRGTLGFNGVRMNSDDLNMSRPQVAIESTAALNQWTVAKLRGLPRIREIKSIQQGGTLRRIQRLDAVTGPNDVITGAQLADGTVDVLFLGTTNEPCWASVFRYKNGSVNEYYANAYVARADQTMANCTVKGYDSWVNGTGAAAILASTEVQQADDRLKLTFSGLPLFFHSRAEDVPPAEMRKTMKCGPFYDVRIQVNYDSISKGAEGTSATKFYSEVYRELMFAPLPVRHVETLPAAHAQGVATPKTFRDTSELSWKNSSPDNLTPLQMPKYLNFTTSLSNQNTEHGLARESNAGSGPQGQAAARAAAANLVPNYSDDSDDEKKAQGGKNYDERAKRQQDWQKRTDQSLQQHYPEVVVNYRGNDTNELGKEVTSFFKGYPEKLVAWKKKFGWLRTLDTDQRGVMLRSGEMKAKLQLAKGRDQPIALQLLAPTTLRGAMARYTEEHKYALAYYTMKRNETDDSVERDKEGNLIRKRIDTSFEKMQKEGGLYYSCRIDTGTGPNEGGLDTLLPLDMESTMYDIADVNLARGVHEYVYSSATKLDDDGNIVQHNNPAFLKRAGAAHWWQLEQAKIKENIDLTLRGLMDPHPYDKEVHFYDVNFQGFANVNSAWRPPVGSVWTDNVVRNPPWGPAPPGSMPPFPSFATTDRYSGRALYDGSLLPANQPDSVQRERFPTYQLRRLDTVEGFPERADLNDPRSWKPDPANPTGPSTLHMALKARMSTTGMVSVLPTVGPSSLLDPTGFHVASEVTRYNVDGEIGREDWVSGKSPAGRYATQAVMFDTFYQTAYPPPPLPPGQFPLLNADASAVVNALPHRHDLRVPCMPIYPSRLSLDARRATWRRLKKMRQAEAHGEDPDVVDADRAAAIQFENSAAMKQDPDKYVRDDLPEDPDYLSLPEYQRRGARKSGYHAARSDATAGAQRGRYAGKFGRTLVVPLYVVALEYDDFKRAVRETDKEWGEFFADYPNYLKRKDEFKVKRRYKNVEEFVDYLVPDEDYRLPTATFPPRPRGSWPTHDGPWYHDDEATVDDDTMAETQNALDPATWDVLERARRPAERTRASWFADRKDFGGLQRDGNPSVLDAFKKRVQRWEDMYGAYMQMRDALQVHATAEVEIEKHVEALNLHSLRVCWGLSRLNRANAQPSDLYKQDGASALLLPDVDLAKQWMRCYDGEIPSGPEDLSTFDRDKLYRFADSQLGLMDCSPLETNQFGVLSGRLPLVIFFMDMVDALAGVRDDVAWLEQRHFELAGTPERMLDAKRARNRRRFANNLLLAAQRTSTPYLDSLGTIAPPNWPDEDKIDEVCRAGGKVLAKVLVALLEDNGTKAAINETAQNIIDEALQKRTEDDDRTFAKRYLLNNGDQDTAATRIKAFVDVLTAPDAEDHALQLNHKHTVHLVLDAWARTIVEKRLALIDNARGEYGQYLPSMAQQTGITWPVFQRAIEPLTNGLLKKRLTRIERDETYGKSADLHAACVLFGMARVRPTGGAGGAGGNDDGGGDWPLPFTNTATSINEPAVKYARELRVIQRLMTAQSSIMMDAQLFRSGVPDYDPAQSETYHILTFTAAAFKYIFVSVQKAQGNLNELLEKLLNGTLERDQLAALEAGLDAVKRRYRDMQPPDVEGRDSEILNPPGTENDDVPESLFEALQITQQVVDTYNPIRRYRIGKRAEYDEKKLKQLNIYFTKKLSTAKATRANINATRRQLQDIEGNGADAEEKKKRVEAAIEKKNEELSNLLVILQTIKDAKLNDERYLLLQIGAAIIAANKKARRPAKPKRGKKPKRGQVAAEPDSDEEEVDVSMMFPAGGAPEPSDETMAEYGDFDPQLQVGDGSNQEEEAEADAAIGSDVLAALQQFLDDAKEDEETVDAILAADPDRDPQEVREQVQAERDAKHQEKEEPIFLPPPSPPFHPEGFGGGSPPPPPSAPPSMPPSPPSDPVQVQMPTGILPLMTHRAPSSIGYVEKIVNDRSKVLSKKALDNAAEELITFLESEVAVLRAQYAKATRELDALRNAQTKEKRAIMRVRAHVIHGELDTNADKQRAELLDELNVGLRALSPQADGVSYSEYLARLKGIGILDPEACNDSNMDEIDAYETHGWKGEYRLHVGRMLRVLPTGGTNGGSCYHLDALPPTPRQWLESKDAVYAPSAPSPSRVDASAHADAAMLQATSLDWGVENIVGPKEDWEGRLDARAKEAQDIRASLQALLQADRNRLLDDTRSRFAPWGYDFDMLAGSDVVLQSE
jgi:hypothetical protein